jgi:hypothetical protein
MTERKPLSTLEDYAIRSSHGSRCASVILEMDGKTPKWNPLFADCMACLGVAPRGGLVLHAPNERESGKKCWGDKIQSSSQGSTLAIVIISMSRPDFGVIGSTRRSTAPPCAFPWICGSRRISGPCLKTSQSFALVQKNGIRELGWLHLLRWGSLWLTFRGKSRRGCGSGT